MDVLVTHYEQRKTVRDSIRNLSEQLGAGDRIYVVDAGSTDGSFHELEKLDATDDIELVYRHGVSRGNGRQIAFEESDADVVVAHADLDTLFYPVLPDLAEYYRELRDERGPGLLLVHGCFISDRSTINRVGGWNDLQVHEDKDLWIRADREVQLYQLPISVVRNHDNFEWRSPSYRLARLYQNYREAIRLGIPSSVLHRSYVSHQSVPTWPVNSVLLTAANVYARRLKQYHTFEDRVPDPREYHLRELTFEALAGSGVIEPTSPPVPETFLDYRSERTYPGKTSYTP